MKILRTISRVILGLVFVFSGFVKGLDPMGTMFRIEDYFIAFGMEWALPLALTLAIILCTVEFCTGLLLLLNVRIRLVTWALLLIMTGFTVLTFFDALNNPVPDCGCFGDAIKLTNWQTFYKNVILMVFVMIIALTRKKAHSILTRNTQNIIMASVIVLFAGFCIYSYNHLPVIDFLNWKVGQNMILRDSTQIQTWLVYKNKATGETKEFLSKDLPWQDSIWMAQWKFIDSKTKNPSPKVEEFQITDLNGNDVTRNFLDNPDYQFLLISYDLFKANRKALIKMEDFYKKANADGYSLILLTSALNEDIDAFRKETRVEYEIYNADNVVLKMMIRSNPGLMLLKNGVIVAKWHYHYFPGYEKVKIKYLKNR
jgi:uncharacterized membrane protein YphA (DoxX/SURF4 family)